MAIVGVVVRWTEDLEARRATQARLAADPRVEEGTSEGDRTAFVIEGATADISAQLHELAGFPGVALVSPVFHDFEDELPPSTEGG
jgi:hypothetical protein